MWRDLLWLAVVMGVPTMVVDFYHWLQRRKENK